MEQWTHKPLVLGSNPSLAIFYLSINTIGSGIPARCVRRTSYSLANPSLAIFYLSHNTIGSGIPARCARCARRTSYLLANPSLAIFYLSDNTIGSGISARYTRCARCARRTSYSLANPSLVFLCFLIINHLKYWCSHKDVGNNRGERRYQERLRRFSLYNRKFSISLV